MINDLNPLIEQIGESKIVLLGEASHGTNEYYVLRKEVSKRLITQKGFNFIAVEADWPECYQVNRYIKGFKDAGKNAYEVLFSFNRWPTWMWANWEMVELIEWLKEHNQNLPKEKQVGFYGLDVYSLWESLNVILGYLQVIDPQAVPEAKKAYLCFEPYAKDVTQYALTANMVPGKCQKDVIEMLVALRKQLTLYKDQGTEELFNAEQNALIVVNAEKYYRTMLRGDVISWNLRDEHMVQTLERLLDLYEDLLEKKLKSKDIDKVGLGPNRAKGVVWAHNTHLGDARATDMKLTETINVGQLVREKYGKETVFTIGFGSYQGSVIAADEWGSVMKRKIVPPARAGSWEDYFHQMGKEDQLVLFKDSKEAAQFLQNLDLRAIGVVYHPNFESGNFMQTVLAQAYDAFIYLENTHNTSLPSSYQFLTWFCFNDIN